MISLADSLVSASSRPLAVRRRPDLVSKRQHYQGTSYWIVKEPIGLNYFRFQEEEFAIMNMVDGHTSLDQIKQRYEAQFPPSKITVEELARFVGNLFQSGLLMADVPGQGDQLKKRAEEKRRKQMVATVSNVLAIRFKGIDPERLLNWLNPKVGWLFSRPAVICGLSLMLTAVLLVTVQFDVFQSKLPTFQDFFAGKNWIYLGITLAVTKILHEFGHGLTCKRFGGECHEMGVMILVLTPCLYCNVSDSWMLPNKWHRAAIGAAGIYVEVVIASFCTFIWWFSESGTMLNQLSLSVMFVCSVSTILFNGNPLLRYDGYYILSDIMEIPNLRQKSTTILTRKLGKWCLGLEEPDDPFLPQRNQAMFALYSIAAVIYRWLVVIMILLFLYRVFEPIGLQVLGQVIAAASLYGLIVHPLWKLGKFFAVPGRFHQVKKARMFATLSVVVGLLAAAFLIPLPHSVYCPLEVQPQDAKQVYVEIPGTLLKPARPAGSQVHQGDVLAELSNLDLELEFVRLQGELETLDERIVSLQLERLQEDHFAADAANVLRETEKRHESVRQQLAQKQQDLDRLEIVAPVDGTVMPGPLVSGRPPVEGLLPTWSGTPLDEHNVGAYLQASDLLCQIGDPQKMEAVLVIDQSDRNFVKVHDRVEIKLSHLPRQMFESRIESIATAELEETPQRLSDKAGGELLTQVDRTTGREVPLSTSYQARALLPNNENMLRIGLRGKAKIHTAPQTIANRLWRFLSQTFSFEL